MKEFTCDLAVAQTRSDEARKVLIDAGRAINPNRVRSFLGEFKYGPKQKPRYALRSSSVDFEIATFNLDILTKEQEILAEASGLTLIKTEKRLPQGDLQTRVVIKGQIKNHTLFMSIEKLGDPLDYCDISWKLTGSIDDRQLSKEDAAVLWVKFYTVLRRDEIRKERREKKEANARESQKWAAARRRARETYKRDVKPLFDEVARI